MVVSRSYKRNKKTRKKKINTRNGKRSKYTKHKNRRRDTKPPKMIGGEGKIVIWSYRRTGEIPWTQYGSAKSKEIEDALNNNSRPNISVDMGDGTTYKITFDRSSGNHTQVKVDPPPQPPPAPPVPITVKGKITIVELSGTDVKQTEKEFSIHGKVTNRNYRNIFYEIIVGFIKEKYPTMDANKVDNLYLTAQNYNSRYHRLKKDNEKGERIYKKEENNEQTPVRDFKDINNNVYVDIPITFYKVEEKPQQPEVQPGVEDQAVNLARNIKKSPIVGTLGHKGVNCPMDSILNIILTFKNPLGDRILYFNKEVENINFLTSIIRKMPDTLKELNYDARYKLFDYAPGEENIKEWDMKQIADYCNTRLEENARGCNLLKDNTGGKGGIATSFLEHLMNYVYSKGEGNDKFAPGPPQSLSISEPTNANTLKDFKDDNGFITFGLDLNKGLKEDMIIINCSPVNRKLGDFKIMKTHAEECYPKIDHVTSEKVAKCKSANMTGDLKTQGDVERRKNQCTNTENYCDYNRFGIEQELTWRELPEYKEGINYHLGEKEDDKNDLRKFKHTYNGVVTEYKLLGAAIDYQNYHYTAAVGDGENYVHIDMLYNNVTVEPWKTRNPKYVFIPTCLIYVKSNTESKLYKTVDFKP